MFRRDLKTHTHIQLTGLPSCLQTCDLPSNTGLKHKKTKQKKKGSLGEGGCSGWLWTGASNAIPTLQGQFQPKTQQRVPSLCPDVQSKRKSFYVSHPTAHRLETQSPFLSGSSPLPPMLGVSPTKQSTCVSEKTTTTDILFLEGNADMSNSPPPLFPAWLFHEMKTLY